MPAQRLSIAMRLMQIAPVKGSTKKMPRLPVLAQLWLANGAGNNPKLVWSTGLEDFNPRIDCLAGVQPNDVYLPQEAVDDLRKLVAAWRCPIMQTVISDVTTELLQAFADAWNRHDVDALMSFMTEDCIFESSAGADVCGTRYVGSEPVRAGFAEVWTVFPDAHWGNARHLVHGDRGVSEWTFTGTRVDGTRVEVHGCNLFTFRGGKIFLKNSYGKNRPLIAI